MAPSWDRKAEAEAFMHSFSYAHLPVGEREAIAAEMKASISVTEAHLSFLGLRSGQTIKDLPIVQDFLKSIDSHRMRTKYRSEMRELCRYLSTCQANSQNGNPMIEVGQAIKPHLAAISASTIYKVTFSERLRLLRTFFRWLFDMRIVDFLYRPEFAFRIDHQASMQLSRNQLSHKQNLPTVEDVKTVLRVVREQGRHSLYATLRMAWHFGLRRVEAIGINRGDFISQNGKWYFSRFGKSERVAAAPKLFLMPSALMADVKLAFDAIGCWDRPLAPLCYFEGQAEKERRELYASGALSRNLTGTELTGITRAYFARYAQKKVRVHDLRRGRATSMRQEGREDSYICRALNMSLSTLRTHYDFSAPEHEDNVGMELNEESLVSTNGQTPAEPLQPDSDLA